MHSPRDDEVVGLKWERPSFEKVPKFPDGVWSVDQLMQIEEVDGFGKEDKMLNVFFGEESG